MDRSPLPEGHEAASRVHRGLADALRDPAGETLQQLVDACLAGVVFFAPLILAGEHPWGRAVLVGTIATAAILWSFHQARRRSGGWNRSGAEWLLAASAGLLLLQLVPLPAHLLHSLSPHLPDALPLWTASAGDGNLLGSWNQVSLHPEATRGALVMLLAYALLFLVVVQRIQSLEDVERLIRWVALAAVGMSVLGLFQLLTGKTDFPWMQENAPPTPRGTVKGTFGDPDSLAHFLALGTGPLLWWCWQVLPRTRERHSRRREEAFADTQQRQLMRLLLFAALAAVGLAGMLTFSRGGGVVMFLAAGVCGAVYWLHRLSGSRAIWGLICVVCLSGAALWLYSYDALAGGPGGAERQGSQLESGNARRKLWQAAMRAVADYPLLGTGAGTYRDVYATYLSESSRFEFRHADNGYLQVFQETGLLGFLLLLVGISYLARWCGRLIRRVRESRAVALAGAITAGLTVCLLHGLVDCVWYVPACLSVAIILAGCGCRLLQLAGGRRAVAPTPLPRSAWIATVFVVLAVSVGMLQNRVPAALAAQDWDRYLVLARGLDAVDSPSALGQLPADGAGLSPTVLARQVPAASMPAATVVASNQLVRRHLQRVLQVTPREARAHLRLARTCLRLFEAEQQGDEKRPLLTELRQAALATRFSSRSEFDAWLERMAGPSRSLLWEALRHARRGLQLCPLQGEGYVYLSELAFLESPADDTRLAYLDQAVLVRPYRHDVLLAAGREAARSGDLDAAVGHWRTVFQPNGEPLRLRLQGRTDIGRANVAGDGFLPDLPRLRALYVRYRDSGQDLQARLVAAPLVHALGTRAARTSGAEAAGLWHELQEIHRFLGDDPRALEAARQAVVHSPDDYLLHRTLADRLLDNQLYQEALQQLQWCLYRHPDDAYVQQKLFQAGRHRS